MGERLHKGLIQVYTGKGKGKTTAALGLALRFWGHGYKVCIIQFMKRGRAVGEYKASLNLGRNFIIKQFGSGKFICGKINIKDRQSALDGLSYAKKIVSEGVCKLVILDEVNCALKYRLLDKTDIKELLAIRHPAVEIVFTGRYAPVWLKDYAHLVTEMKEIKHYYQKDIPARLGIEF